jgi:molecular chaperone IbpA
MKNFNLSTILTQYPSASMSFDDVFDRLDAIIQSPNSFAGMSAKYPPTNIQKTDDGFVIEMAVAGFKKNELVVTFNKRTRMLKITGTKEPAESSVFLVKTLATRSFNVSQSLDNNLEVKDTKLEDGILTINVIRIEKPEEEIITLEIQ